MKQSNSIFSGLKFFLFFWGSQAVSSLGSAMTVYALIVWAYEKQGTAMSVALLAVCASLPPIFLGFFAGAVADRWNKRTILLVCNAASAAGTLAALILFCSGRLEMRHLYGIHLVIGLVNTFEIPAASVAVSQLAPPDQYMRVGGLQAFSDSLITLFAPAAATALFAFAGLRAVLILDLATFVFDFLVLCCMIRIPDCPRRGKEQESFIDMSLSGLRFLKRHRAIFGLILFFAFCNFLDCLSARNLTAPMILARTGNNTILAGTVASAVGIGSLLGSVAVTLVRPPKNRARVILLSCALSFGFADLSLALGKTPAVWIAGTVIGYFCLPWIDANMMTVFRDRIPLEMQGRVFSARQTLQYFTVPLGYFLGGFFADRVFGPLMEGASPMRQALVFLVGSGKGSGMAVLFLLTGLAGAAGGLLALANSKFRELG